MTLPLTEQRRQALKAAEIRARLMSPSNSLELRRLSLAIDLANEEIGRLKADLELAHSKIAAKDRRIERSLKYNADLKRELDRTRTIIEAMKPIRRLLAVGKKSIDLIIKEVLDAFPKVSWDDIISYRRGGSEVARCRKLCMYEVRTQRPDMSYPAIARIFNRKDHTTILAAVKQISAEKAAQNGENH